MPPDEIAKVESLILQFPSIAKFLGIWLSQEIRKARRSQHHHVILGYLASPSGYDFAEKTGRIFEIILSLIPSQCQRLRKKVVETTKQSEFEAVLFELEIISVLFKRRNVIEIEPLGRSRKGPDIKTKISGYDTYIEAKKLQHDAEAERLWKTKGNWTRTQTESDLNRREWGLYERYLLKHQFPDDGLHVLVVDTSKHARGDKLISRAWEYYCDPSKQEDPSRRSIHYLILCRRQKHDHISQLNDLTAGAVILENARSSWPRDVFETLANTFS